MAEFIVGSSIGEGTDFNKGVCMFCSDFFDEKHPSVTPDIKMLDAVFNAAEARLDQIGQNLQYKAGIKSGSIEIKYHRNCCSTLQAHIT